MKIHLIITQPTKARVHLLRCVGRAAAAITQLLYTCTRPHALSTRLMGCGVESCGGRQWGWSELRGLAPQVNHFPGPYWLPLGPTHALIIPLTPSTHPAAAVGVIQAEGVGLNFGRGALSGDRHLCSTKSAQPCCSHNKRENDESVMSKADFATSTAVWRGGKIIYIFLIIVWN